MQVRTAKREDKITEQRKKEMEKQRQITKAPNYINIRRIGAAMQQFLITI